MEVSKQRLKQLIFEELNKQDVKDIVDTAVEKQIKHELPKALKKKSQSTTFSPSLFFIGRFTPFGIRNFLYMGAGLTGYSKLISP